MNHGKLIEAVELSRNCQADKDEYFDFRETESDKDNFDCCVTYQLSCSWIRTLPAFENWIILTRSNLLKSSKMIRYIFNVRLADHSHSLRITLVRCNVPLEQLILTNRCFVEPITKMIHHWPIQLALTVISLHIHINVPLNL